MIALWNTIFYEPLYNGLVFLTSVVPWADVGIAVIVLTLIVKIILSPLSKKSIKSQARLKALEPEIEKIKEIYKDKQEQAKKTFELYKTHKTNPFSGCLLILIQLPIIIALYWVFLKGLDFKPDALYSFVNFPETFNMNFLGIIDMQKKSIILALLAGISQFIHTKIAAPSTPPAGNKKSLQAEFMKSMNVQMKYVLPVFVAFISYQISAAVALYWTVSNIFTITQEIFVRRKVNESLNSKTIVQTEATVVENKQLK